MDHDQFWTLVEATRLGGGDDCEQHTERLTAALRTLPPSEIRAFDTIRWQLLAESYRWDLWGVSSLLIGTDSEDGFEYFRGWLIGQGRAVFQAAVRDPDSLAEHPGVQAVAQYRPLSPFRGEFMCESLLYVAYVAYDAVTGTQLELTDLELAQVPLVHNPAGEPYPEDAAGWRRQYPRLWQLLGPWLQPSPRTSSL
jgi:hypothetical protein